MAIVTKKCYYSNLPKAIYFYFYSRLSLELLNKVRNPEAASSQSSSTYSGVASASAIDDDEGLAQNVPMRIASRSSKNKEKTTSEINSK